jgi:hypothetical protein
MESLSICLTFSTLLGYLHSAIDQIVDPRKPGNNTNYSIKDAVLSAFSVFFMQCPSFLENQRQMQSRKGKDNAQTLFEVQAIPCDNQIRNILDGIVARSLRPIFTGVYQALAAGGYLKAYQVLGKNILIPLDGTEYFSSQKIHCQCCSSRQHKNGTVTYFHQALLPVIVAPDNPHVISLAPEFITPQDGHDKQDCEIAAAKRWIDDHAQQFKDVEVTLLGDDLYSRQPLCELCLEKSFNFLFVCLPESHSSLYKWLDCLEANGKVHHLKQRHWDGKKWLLYHYRYINSIPLREQQPALLVNWFEVTVIRETDGKRLYHNAFITHHLLTDRVMPEITRAARSRWKTENENHNILKTKGYHLEHNFGHGQQHLASFLLTLNLLAFLFHTVLLLVDPSYQLIRQRIVRRDTFFEHLRTLTRYLVFESWQKLINFMLTESEPRRSRRTKPGLDSS